MGAIQYLHLCERHFKKCTKVALNLAPQSQPLEPDEVAAFMLVKAEKHINRWGPSQMSIEVHSEVVVGSRSHVLRTGIQKNRKTATKKVAGASSSGEDF